MGKAKAASEDYNAQEIDGAVFRLLKAASDQDIGVQLQALNTAIKWYGVKNKVRPEDWGSDLGKEGEED